VVTADKALLEILQESPPYAPCSLPEGRLVPLVHQVAIPLEMLNDSHKAT
jgi:hypothetical protein